MADVRAFRGIRYSPARVNDLSQVITQPYDKISKEMQAAYLKKHPNSYVNLILPAADDPYAYSTATCNKWLADSLLAKDARPAIYVLHQDFTTGGKAMTRKSFIAAIRVEEFEKGTVLPHERTLSRPKADRLNLLRATKKDYEQIFLLYSDPSGEVDRLLSPQGKPDMQATDDLGVVQKVWAITDPAKLTAVNKALADKVMLIADGHHRYETALNYRKEMEAAGTVQPDAALRFKTSAFVNIADPGLVILPTHRLLYDLPQFNLEAALARLAGFFKVEAVEGAKLAATVAAGFVPGETVFGLYAGKDKAWTLKLSDKTAMQRFTRGRSPDYCGLDVAVLHTLVIDQVFGVPAERIEDHVAYERKADETLAKVDSSKYQVALLLNPTRAEQVQKVAARGERMPQKSTDFYPKFISGLVFMDVAETERL
jgi:uncharacterized protein (DUF1015 family)